MHRAVITAGLGRSDSERNWVPERESPVNVDFVAFPAEGIEPSVLSSLSACSLVKDCGPWTSLIKLSHNRGAAELLSAMLLLPGGEDLPGKLFVLLPFEIGYRNKPIVSKINYGAGTPSPTLFVSEDPARATLTSASNLSILFCRCRLWPEPVDLLI